MTNNYEIDITALFNAADFRPSYYSASCAELGQDAGEVTWQNAVDRSEEMDLLLTDEKRDVFRDYVRGFGAWTDEEINSWTNIELNALLLQMISGDIRESGLHANMSVDEWREYEIECTKGTYAGNIYCGPLCVPEFTDRVFYSIG